MKKNNWLFESLKDGLFKVVILVAFCWFVGVKAYEYHENHKPILVHEGPVGPGQGVDKVLRPGK